MLLPDFLANLLHLALGGHHNKKHMSSIFRELKRRNVFRVEVALVSWAAQRAMPMFETVDNI